ncbi:hypothetical protein [Kribbella deserti]|uniref:Uncharacterized protein n=1 Tax=Kribbella deserti TaxID=1926257 RepID=A0ABV6QE81_9ACTN
MTEPSWAAAPYWLSAGLTALSLVVLAFAQAVLFGGSTAGTSVRFLGTFNDLVPRYGLSDNNISVAAVVAAALVSWTVVAAGMTGLLRNALAESAHGAVFGPFWDSDLQQANDVVFRTNPSKAALQLLRERYGVRWLVFDTSLDKPSPIVRKLLPQRFKQGSLEIYELVALSGTTASTPARHIETDARTP